MSKISKRLKLIAGLVDKKIVSDVGCDHGKLIDYLFKNNQIEFAYVSDISLPSLNKAIRLLSNSKYKFEAIHCDGLLGYTDVLVDQCIISGMGGDEIIKIVSNSPIEINSFILSPQHNNIDVKRFMLSQNYTIIFDIIIEDKGKFYNILKFDKNNSKYNISEFDLYFGKDNFTNKESCIDNYIFSEIEKNTKLLEITNGNRKEEILEYLKYLQIAKTRRNL